MQGGCDGGLSQNAKESENPLIEDVRKNDEKSLKSSKIIIFHITQNQFLEYPGTLLTSPRHCFGVFLMF